MCKFQPCLFLIFPGETTSWCRCYKGDVGRTSERDRRVSTHILYQQGDQGMHFYLL